MKFVSSICLGVLFLSCANDHSYSDVTKNSDLQVLQIQSRLDSMITSLQPKQKLNSKKPESKTSTARRASNNELSADNTSGSYTWQTKNSNSTPTVRSNKFESYYRLRVGAICKRMALVVCNRSWCLPISC